jgi:hypothetical protein
MDPRFYCDSMLGGLARWLRSAGYDAEFAGPIEDGELVAGAAERGAVLLTSDGPLMRRRPIASGSVRALFVPRAASLLEQTAFVLGALDLPLRDPRCLACGGEIAPASPAEVQHGVPEISRAVFDAFWRCTRCGRTYWKGAHWDGIVARREEIARALHARSGVP